MKVEEASPSLPDVRCQKFAFQAAITRPRKFIFLVTGTNDSSAGSLHDAITQANNTAGADTINFDNFILDGRTKGIL
ncbi:hypothetical protein WA1_09070 [Scytonema hofmannii PCC 7110]|uniref:Uncharacterized protein n=1 Tax=Scytonema hofmannii PCC 7110 TaxID=128403 RepID=A0A139WS77_9CYAN|nr:hypothetical protein [Scytonema hofmannii]KYC35294.1 hypothetical protein WA1_09070 [Scytonema hofmannii PCC 7110]